MLSMAAIHHARSTSASVSGQRQAWETPTLRSLPMSETLGGNSARETERTFENSRNPS
jgi:hypothetical protein